MDAGSDRRIFADVSGIPCVCRCISQSCFGWSCLVVLATDPFNRNIYYGSRRRTWRCGRRGPLCADYQRLFSVSPGLCARHRPAGSPLRRFGRRTGTFKDESCQFAAGHSRGPDCLYLCDYRGHDRLGAAHQHHSD